MRRAVAGALALALLTAACARPHAPARSAKNHTRPATRDDDGAAAVDLGVVEKQAADALEKKDYARAEALARQVVGSDAAGYPYAHVILGDVALARKAYDEALDHYARARALDPKDGWAVVRSSEALQGVGRKEEARALLRGFVAGAKDADADVLTALGWLEMDLGDGRRAETAFREAVRVSKGASADAHYGLAIGAATRHDLPAVRKEVATVLKLDPERRDELAKDEALEEVRTDPAVKELLSPPR